MSIDLVLRPSCEACGATTDLYGSECKHMTLCLSCGKNAAASRSRCRLCGSFIVKLIREYNVRASSNTDKNFYIGRFVSGLPPFSKKKSAENRWSLHKEGLQGRQITDSLREKYKNKPWILEDETGQYQFQGQVEGSQSTTATYYLLMMHGKEFHAFPAGSWYNFSKKAQYKQLTLEEAEEKMNKRKHNATGYERWLMKAAANGPAAFPVMNKNEAMSTGGAEGSRLKKGKGHDDKDHSDKGEEDEEEEGDRKARLGLSQKGMNDDEEGGKAGDFDLDDDDIEKGDDWEHEEVFTDDDEAVGNDPEEREDLAPEIPAPPEIKQDEEEEEEENEEEGGLSKSGKELKKLLGRAAGLNESDGDDDEDDEEEDDMSPVLAPKRKETSKDEPAENVPSKTAPSSGSNRPTPGTSKPSKSKRKSGSDDKKHTKGSSTKKPRVDNSGIKDENASLAKPSETLESSAAAARTGSTPSAAARTGSTPSAAVVTEDEIKAVLLSPTPVTAQALVSNFKDRLRSQEDKKAFADTLKRISKIQKSNGHSYVVLRER